MKLVSVNKLEPGMVVSENIYTLDDRLVLTKGTVLDSNGIEKIKAHSLYNIFVENEKKAVVEAPEKKEKVDPNLSYSQRLKNTESFIKFKQHIEENAEKLEESFRLIANESIPLDVDRLTEPVYHLFVEAGGSAGVFDMLHNLRDSSDAVYMHSLNVALICNTLATWMRLPTETIQVATAGGLLHDIGKVLMPPDLVNKSEALTEYEQKAMREHVIKGYDLVKNTDIDQRIKNCILMHHEMRDGSGYPFHIKNDQIDEVASIVTVANVYEALTATRTYRAPVCPFTIIANFEDNGIDKYNPNVIMTFLSNVVNTFIANRVLLNNGQSGEIIFVNPDHLSRPTIKVGDQFVDLSQNRNLSIVSII